MWPFKKKKFEALDLPPLPKQEDKEIMPTMTEEEPLMQFPEVPSEDIPDEIPPLELNEEQEGVSEPVIETAKQEKYVIKHKFMKISKYQEIMGEIMNLNNNFSNIDYGISRVFELKGSRDSRIDSLQISLEDVSKKLILVDDTLFGG